MIFTVFLKESSDYSFITLCDVYVYPGYTGRLDYLNPETGKGL
jgi:hypothetical protein